MVNSRKERRIQFFLIISSLFLLIFSCAKKSELSNVGKNTNPEVVNFDKQVDSILLQEISSIIGKVGRNNSAVRYRKTKRSNLLVTIHETYDTLVPGIRFDSIEQSKARQVLSTYLEKAKKLNNYIYLTNLNFDLGEKYKSYYDLVILPFNNQTELVKMVGTSAINYDLDNQDIVEWLNNKKKEFDFDIIVIDSDRLEAVIKSPPYSYPTLAKSISEFCPDVIEQGHDDIRELIKMLKTENCMWFWWD